MSPIDQPPDTLAVWVVYDHPPDYPEGYVLRPQFAGRAGVSVSSEAWCSPSLEGVRALLPPGLTLLGREPADDPSILEVWI